MTCAAAAAYVLAAARQLVGQFNPWSFVVGVAGSALVLWWMFRPNTAARSVSIGLPFGLGSATFELTQQDRVAAWKLHVQLVTRKAALPFDQRDDVISDVLSSLFDLFKVARDLLLEMPPASRNDQYGVANLIIRILNSGVRPVLTRWQADYRRWWDAALMHPDNAARSPQEIQRDYPRYTELVKDLERMNTELSKFSDQLALVASGASPRPVSISGIVPEAPEVLPSVSVASTQTSDNRPPTHADRT